MRYLADDDERLRIARNGHRRARAEHNMARRVHRIVEIADSSGAAMSRARTRNQAVDPFERELSRLTASMLSHSAPEAKIRAATALQQHRPTDPRVVNLLGHLRLFVATNRTAVQNTVDLWLSSARLPPSVPTRAGETRCSC